MRDQWGTSVEGAPCDGRGQRGKGASTDIGHMRAVLLGMASTLGAVEKAFCVGIAAFCLPRHKRNTRTHRSAENCEPQVRSLGIHGQQKERTKL